MFHTQSFGLASESESVQGVGCRKRKEQKNQERKFMKLHKQNTNTK